MSLYKNDKFHNSIVLMCLLCGMASAERVMAQPLDQASAAWRVVVDYAQPLAKVPDHFASVNVNAPKLLLKKDSHAFTQSVRDLGVSMMRFQVPLAKLDYKDTASWPEDQLASLDEAVSAAYERWGVRSLMFGIHRIALPFSEDGRLVEEDMPAYAEACAELVRRYSPPGDDRVMYWEPFNELDANRLMNRMKSHGQSFQAIARLWKLCAQEMKKVNPEIIVGGPALTTPNDKLAAQLLEVGGDLVGFVSWHDYPAGSASTSDAQVLYSITNGLRFLNGANRMGAVAAAMGKPELPLFLNEFQVNWRAWDPEDPRTINNFAGVFTASILANLSTTQVDGLFIHDLFGRHYGLIATRGYDRLNAKTGFLYDGLNDDAIHIRPAGWVYRWFNELAGGRWVSCKRLIPEADFDSSRGSLLDATAWQNGNRRYLLLVNKDEAAHTVEVQLNEPVPTDGDALPIAFRGLIDGRPVVGRMAGTRGGALSLNLAPMSVMLLSYDLP